ncbi:MAG TPA: hypothetical protein VIK78_14555 [Ruminiclostridium sp.]
MNSLTVRWKLHNYYNDLKMIEQLKDDLKEYRLMDGVKALVVTDMPGCHSTTSKVESVLTENYKYKNEELELPEYIKSLENELDSLMRIKRAIDNVYLYLREPARTIIEMRYFITPQPLDVRQRKYNWAEIGDEIHMSEDRCKHIDCDVIRQIQNKTLDSRHTCNIVY